MKLFDSFGNYLPRYTYLRIFFLVASIFSAIFILFSVILSQQFSFYANNEINKFAQDKVAQAANNTEFIMNNLKNYSYKMYSDLEITDWLYSEKINAVNDMRIQQVLTSYLNSEPFIKKVYLFNMKTKRVIDSSEKGYDFQEFPDQKILDELENGKEPFKPYFNYISNNLSYIAITIPQSFSVNDYNAYMIVLLDKEIMQKYLLSNNINVGINVVVMDENGKVVLGFVNEDTSKQIHNNINKKNSGSFSFKDKNDTLAVNFAKLKIQNWTVCNFYSMKEMYLDTVNFQIKFILSILFLLIILLIIIYWNSKRTFKPISNLANEITGLVYNEDKLNKYKTASLAEYITIKSGIDKLLSNVNDLKSSIRKNQDIIMSDHLRQWIFSGKLDKLNEKYIFENSSLLKYKYLFLCVIRIESYATFSKEYDFESRSTIKYGILNIAKELIEKEENSFEGLDLDGDHVILLIGSNLSNEQELFPVLENIQVLIDKLLKIKVTIATSSCKNFSDDLRDIYNSIYDCTLLKFIWGMNKTYTEKDNESYGLMKSSASNEDLVNNIIKVVRLGAKEDIRRLLNDFINNMQSISYVECKFHVILMVYSIVKAFNKLTDFQDFNGISNFINNFSTLNEIKEWLEKELIEISTNVSNIKVQNKRDDAMIEVVEYVKKHLSDSMLSVEDIAEHISLSAGYLRQSFKGTYNITLSDYILEQRIENVKTLLKTTDWTISDIAERSGFQTKSHFFTVFKKSTGITPNQFRES